MKGNEIRVSDKFKKRDFVLTDASNPQYPQHISFQLTQDKCSVLDNINVGDNVQVTFNLRGREWISPQNETKYFNTLEAFKIDVVGTNAEQSAAPRVSNSEPPIDNVPLPTAEDDLPF